MGGAYGRVADDATPFPNRSANYSLNIYEFWADAADDEHDVAWVCGLHGATTPSAMAGAYVNALVQDGGRGMPGRRRWQSMARRSSSD